MADFDASRYAKLEFSTQEEDSFVQKLLACEAVSDEEKRKQILSFLPKKVTTRIGQDHTPFNHVLNIVKTCDRFEAIKGLIEAVYRIEEDTKHWRQLKTYLEERLVIQNNCSNGQLDKLEAIVAAFDWPEELLKEAYQKCQSSRPLPNSDLPNTEMLREMLRELQKCLLRSDGIRPLVEFVERLALGATAVCQQLRQWNDEISQTPDQQASLKRLRERLFAQDISPVRKATPYLLVKISEGDNAKRFIMQVWLLIGDRQLFDATYDTSCEIEELQKQLETCLRKSAEKLGKAFSELVIEIFLPTDLLYQQVEQWEVSESDNFKRWIARKYKLVLRIGERLDVIGNPGSKFGSSWWSQWESKWEKLQQHNQKSCPTCADHVFIPTPTCYQQRDSFVAWLEDAICLALPVPLPLDTGVDVIDDICSQGTPVAFWIREPSTDFNTTETWFKDLLKTGSLNDLPHMIHNERKKGAKSNDLHHPGNHLALIWDDPTRLPPGFEYQTSQLSWPYQTRQSK